MSFFWPTKNDDITEYHLSIFSKNNIIFSEFFLSANQKSIVIIDNAGFYHIYFFNKEKTQLPNAYGACKWI